MHPINNLNIGVGAKKILHSRGIYLCSQVCQYTKKELTAYGFTREMMDSLAFELRELGYETPKLRKSTAKRKSVDWESALSMPKGVKLFGGEFRGACIKEDDEQIASYNWWCLNNPGLEKLFVHINNETVSNVQGYMKSIRKGMLPRAPDNLIIYPAGGHIGFACELKRKDIRKSLSTAERRQHFEEQKQLLSKWHEMGMYVCVACGAEEFASAWHDYISNIDID